MFKLNSQVTRLAAILLLIIMHVSAPVTAGELVAEYRFNSIIDGITDDSSGKGNSARVFGPKIIPAGAGRGLIFDGVDDYVDCGNTPSLNLSKEASIECWVRPDALPSGEVGIAGKGTSAYGLTFYSNGRVYWYIADGSNAVYNGVALGVWQHVAGTYDGKTSRLYINGKMVHSKDLGVAISQGENFYIGATGPGSGVFPGGIAGVKVYDYALPPELIASRFNEVSTNMLAKVDPITVGKSLTVNGLTVRVSATGGIQVDAGADRYNIETHLSHPGDSIGWNVLGTRGILREWTWLPRLEKTADGLVVTASGAHYSLKREIKPDGHRLIVTDTLTNISGEDVGIIYANELTTPEPFKQRLLCGADQAGAYLCAENPSAFVAQSGSSLALLAEDTLLRLQISLASSPNSVRMTAQRFALQPGKSYTFRWAVYPQKKGADYWAFVNRVRKDWDVNFRIAGPWVWFDLTSRMDMIRDHEALKKYLTRNRAQVVSFAPWVDYDNFNAMTGKPATRAETKALMQEAYRAVKAVDPNIICVGCIEGNLVSLPEEVAAEIYETVKGWPQNQYPFTAEQMEIMKKHKLRWQDCLLMNKDGNYRLELYYRGPKEQRYPMFAIAVYPGHGNGQHLYWLDQAEFLLKDVGVDGLYIDQFNLAFNDDQRYSYEGWDGVTVDIDKQTGRITRRYIDGGYVSIGAQKDLVEYVLREGVYMLANTFPASPEMQSLRMHRFNESEWAFEPLKWGDGEKPPLQQYPCDGHFSTPISLGYRPNKWDNNPAEDENYAKVIMKMAIAYLRHGLLYYHYGTEIPEAGPGSGEYGAINHMFPITPVELNEGYIVGKERTVTCVSGAYTWSNARRPEVLVFDITGRPVTPRAEVLRVGSKWKVNLKLKDWAEIAVIK